MTSPDDQAPDPGPRDEPAPDHDHAGAPSDAETTAAQTAFMQQFLVTPEQQNGFAEPTEPAAAESVDEEPDVGFTLAGAMGATPPVADPAEVATAISHQIARELGGAGPDGWQRLEAVFAVTVAAEVALAVFTDDEERMARAYPPEEVLTLVRQHRHVSAQLSDGPWWRYTMTLTSSGQVEVDYDYGDEPFPDEQLFAPEIYRADLEVYPRDVLPVWLAAYIGHADRQSRTPQEAAVQARADRDAGRRGALAANDFPAFPLLAARWAVIAAGFVAAGSPLGPRVLPALSWFEGSKRSGSTLYTVPGGRAVLSGGVWNAPELNAVYNEGVPMPALYAGAPEWVANPVLNSRAASGLLSFCYWWEGGNWYRGMSPIADELSDAVPGMWSPESVVDIVSGLIAESPSPRLRQAVANLVSAAEIGVVTRSTLVDVFGEDGTFDIDSALYQLTMAGVTMTVPEPMPQEDAIARVRQFILNSGMDTSRYPMDGLRADRISIGWMVYVPTAPGEIAIGRALFYIADDGVLEQSSSSVAPSLYIAEFEQRFQRRHGQVDA
ncbi:hypothetical protein [Nocardia colli]|uniref:hypothetical protein n=1 Tax=Nocardia colli TaxID=2545717 RepID=UPI001CC6DA02|nr:hypothetical protein [Nocardia colli]